MTTRAERRRTDTRRRIADAARALLVEQGFGGLRMSDVAERADVAFGSLYTHFENKEAIVDAAVAATLEELFAATWQDDRTYADPAVEVAAAARRVIRIALDQRELATALLSLDRPHERFVDILGPPSTALLERGAAAGRFTVTDAAATTAYLLAGGFELIRGVLDGRMTTDADVLCASISLRTLGLAPDEAEAIARSALPPNP